MKDQMRHMIPGIMRKACLRDRPAPALDQARILVLLRISVPGSGQRQKACILRLSYEPGGQVVYLREIGALFGPDGYFSKFFTR